MKIQAGDIRMEYELFGPERAPVAMLSHSLATAMGMWAPQIEALTARFRVLRFDTRGHGGSDAPPGAYSLDQLADDSVALMDALNLETVIWIGLSMGGMIGQNLALRHGQRLEKLVLCDTAAQVPAAAQEVWQGRIDIARQQGMGALVNETLERWFTPAYLERNPPTVEQIRSQILATPVAGFVGCSEAIRRIDYLDALPAITLPALIVVGEEDPGTPVSAARAIQERIRGSRLAILPDARHLSNIEQADAFNWALMDFLQAA